MFARIYKPTKTAMQSGKGNAQQWAIQFEAEDVRTVEPLMGWTSSGDMDSQVRLRFDTREAAEAYANERGIEFDVVGPHARQPNIRPRGYGENFATDRRGAWTH